MKKKLSENIREQLKKPIGRLEKGKKLVETLKKEKKLVTIGDIVTFTVLKNNIKPVMAIVDFRTRRGDCPSKIQVFIKSFFTGKTIVENPAGGLTDRLWSEIKSFYRNIDQKKPFLIEVKGEEDMASLAAIYLAPRDVTIIYGLPDKGVVIVKPTLFNKKLVKKVLDEM